MLSLRQRSLSGQPNVAVGSFSMFRARAGHFPLFTRLQTYRCAATNRRLGPELKRWPCILPATVTAPPSSYDLFQLKSQSFETSHHQCIGPFQWLVSKRHIGIPPDHLGQRQLDLQPG